MMTIIIPLTFFLGPPYLCKPVNRKFEGLFLKSCWAGGPELPPPYIEGFNLKLKPGLIEIINQ